MIIILLLFIVSPWLVQLFVSPVELSWITYPVSSIAEFWRNLAFYTSPEFIFFSGDRRLAYGTQEFGLLYLSWLPLIWLGSQKQLWWWVGGGIIVASAFKITVPFSAALLYILPLQLLVASGAKYLITNFRRFGWSVKLVVVALVLFNFYEIANFIHVLAVHYPQRIHEAVVN